MSHQDAILHVDMNAHGNITTYTNDLRNIPTLVEVHAGGKIRKIVIALCIIAGALVLTVLGIGIDIAVKVNKSTIELTTLSSKGNITETTATVTTSDIQTTETIATTTSTKSEPISDPSDSNSTFVIPIVLQMGNSSRPYHLSVGDINNDTKPDIVFANEYQHHVGILINSDDGIFPHVEILSVGSNSHPQYVSLADINADEELDILVAILNNGECSFGVLLNKGGHIFPTQRTYSTGYKSYPSSLTVGDLNNDSLPDVVLACTNNNIILIYLNIGGGQFQCNQSFFEINNGPHFPSIVDIDDDTYPDVVVSKHASNEIAILYNSGNGTLFPPQTYSTGKDSYCQEHRLVDINNDTKLDIIVANFGTDNIGIFINTGNGGFHPQKTISTGINSGPRSLVVVDITNDQYPDIIVANSRADNIQIYKNLGDGRFILREIYLLQKGAYPNSLVIFDLNDDEKLDMIVANRDKEEILVYLAR